MAVPTYTYMNLPNAKNFYGYGGNPNGLLNQNPQQQLPMALPPSNPFTSASSGGLSGTLQPYINRMTQNASNALYGGLLNYQPNQMIAGNAGGTPQNSQVPNFNLQGLLSNFQGFGNRSWMGK